MKYKQFSQTAYCKVLSGTLISTYEIYISLILHAMSYIKKVQKMEQLHKLILNEFRGSAKDYAEKLRISRGSLFNYLEDLKQAGAVISYCRNSNCFTYVNQFELELRVYSQAVNSIELNSSGGKE